MKNLVGFIRRAAPLLWVCLALASAPTSARAQEEDIKIRSIEVQYTGPQTITRDRILAQMRTKVGQTYSHTIVEEDIRSLYATGQVQNVRIFGEQQGDGVKVIVAVQTRANVNEIEINGATRLNAKALRRKIKLKVNAPLDEGALGKAKQDILTAYRAKGYNDIDVDYRIDVDDARGTSRVVFTINEGEKGTVSRVQFEGNNHISDRVLRKQMKTKPKSLISFLDKSGRLDEAQLQQDLDASANITRTTATWTSTSRRHGVSARRAR
jgi:outer membrane protein insertion porin family